MQNLFTYGWGRVFVCAACQEERNSLRKHSLQKLFKKKKKRDLENGSQLLIWHHCYFWTASEEEWPIAQDTNPALGLLLWCWSQMIQTSCVTMNTRAEFDCFNLIHPLAHLLQKLRLCNKHMMKGKTWDGELRCKMENISTQTRRERAYSRCLCKTNVFCINWPCVYMCCDGECWIFNVGLRPFRFVFCS